MFYRFLLALVYSGLSFYCSDKSLVECKTDGQKNCVSPTPDEKAMEAMNNGDEESAETILLKLIDEDPSGYFRYPRISIIYAHYADLDFYKLLENQVTGKQSGSFDPTTIVPEIDPKNPADYDKKIDFLTKAINFLKKIPKDILADETNYFVSSAHFQLMLYQLGLPLMIIKKYSSSVHDISQLTPDEAILMVGSLTNASGEAKKKFPENSDQIDKSLNEINAQPGATINEKVKNFLAKEKKKKAKT